MDGSNPTALTSQPYLDLNDPANKHYYGIQNDRTADLDAAMDKYWKVRGGGGSAHWGGPFSSQPCLAHSAACRPISLRSPRLPHPHDPAERADGG